MALLLLGYLHDRWQPEWAAGCGVVGGVGVRRLVAALYRGFPALLRRPLDAASLLLGTIVAVLGALVTGPYSFVYLVSIWREAVALPVVAAFLGLGIAGVIYAHGRIEREIEERERLEQDLRLARGIQQSLLVSEFPEMDWIEVRAVNVPSRSVGGDYYEVFGVADERLGFAVGDVAGKGVPAALLMSTLQSSFLGVCGIEEDLSVVCHRVNEFLVRRTSPERYATFFAARILGSAGGRSLEYVNAGHNPPIVVRRGEVSRLRGGGMPLGLFPEASYELQAVGLEAGDLLVCFTDGVTEAQAPDEEEFGEARLLEVVGRSDGADAGAVIGAIQAAVAAFTRGAPQHDDLTLLVLRLR